MPPEKKPAKKPVSLDRSSVVILFVIVFLGMGAMFGLGNHAGRKQGPVMYDYMNMRDQLGDIKKALSEKEIRRGQVREKPTNLTQEAGDNTGEHLLYEPSKSAAKDYTPRTVSGVLQPAVAVLKEMLSSKSGEKKNGAGPAGEETASSDSRALTPGAVESMAKWTVQVASVTSADEAAKISDRLSRKGYPAWIMVVEKSTGEEVHRVRVGRYGNRTQADMVRKSLSDSAAESFVTTIE